MLQHRIHILTLLLFDFALLVGCGTNRAPVSMDAVSDGVWDTVIFRDRKDVPPITTSHGWIGNEVIFLIVPNFKRAGGGGGSGRGGLPPETWIHGKICLPDGKTQIHYEATSVQGEVGSVTIADRHYDLKNGRLFFVLLSDAGFDVTQVNKDTRCLAPRSNDAKEIEDFLQGVSQFHSFLSDATKERFSDVQDHWVENRESDDE